MLMQRKLLTGISHHSLIPLFAWHDMHLAVTAWQQRRTLGRVLTRFHLEKELFFRNFLFLRLRFDTDMACSLP
jgi:hypothetical protein